MACVNRSGGSVKSPSVLAGAPDAASAANRISSRYSTARSWTSRLGCVDSGSRKWMIRAMRSDINVLRSGGQDILSLPAILEKTFGIA